MYNVLRAVRHAPARLAHASSSTYPAALGRPRLSRLLLATAFNNAKRHASTLTDDVTPQSPDPPSHSDLHEFITILSSADSLSPAAVSRSASRVIRSSVRKDNVAEAVIILSALRAANGRRTAAGNPTLFPLRLPSTTLVHGLLQQNNIHQAARLARDVMPVQEHLFRAKTIDLVVKALCPTPAEGEVGGRTASERMTQWKRNMWTREGWALKPLPPAGSAESLAPEQWPRASNSQQSMNPFSAPGQVSQRSETAHSEPTETSQPQKGQGLDASTRMAIALLAQARRTKQSRTNDMYKRVVNACLLQGELVTATLLFAILLYDLRRSQTRNQPEQSVDSTENVLQTSQGQEAIHRFHLHRRVLNRSEVQAKEMYERFRAGIGDCAELPGGEHWSTAWELMRSISWEMSEFETRDSDGADRTRGILATMWMLWGMPFPRISLLVKSLYSVKKAGTPWPPGADPKKKDSTTYGFCHAVLAREVVQMTALRSKYCADRTKQHPLDIRSYNALLHYALRHRLSPTMAEAILHHMQHERKPALQPDQATYAILLRSASLLRQNGAASQILQRFADAKDEEIVSSLARIDEIIPPKRLSRKDVFPTHLAMDIPMEPKHAVPRPETQLGDLAFAEPAVINSIIAHYISTGRANHIVQIIPLFLPTLQRRILNAEEKMAALHRMVVLGPSTFSHLLNACVKAGKSGTAERVWRLALQAERASWNNGPWGEARHGWLLGIAPYTLMMQMYSNEGKIGLTKVHRARREYVQIMKQRELHVVGWGHHIQYAPGQKYRSLPPHGEIAQLRLRWLVARHQGIRFIRSLRYGGMRVFRRVTRLILPSFIPEKIAYDPQAVKRWKRRAFPDARFFNACLDLFGKMPSMRQRNPTLWSRQSVWMRAYRRNAKARARGQNTMRRDEFLPYILGWMRQLHFPIPLAFAHIRSKNDDKPEGFQDPQLTEAHLRSRLGVRPFAYPESGDNFHAYRIAVTKDRGLPIRRKGGFSTPRGRRQRRVLSRYRQAHAGRDGGAAGARNTFEKKQGKLIKEGTEPTVERAEQDLKGQEVAATADYGPGRWDIAPTRSQLPRRRAVVERPSVATVEPEAEVGSAVDRALSFAFSM
ncbi:hypothetical protein CALVIDRAFT_192806 [Calocera viscosa TUFC12733]|uniref:Uncharacterized protein n=1 Tax=Calocera viscosa (strain TUFC12733) TaxID=1330018 RepID=A0A167KQ10_CALVF|nr:hypothetical protein CALVIDRAFT_192806 [Calocera viscosa TUFC12733]